MKLSLDQVKVYANTISTNISKISQKDLIFLALKVVAAAVTAGIILVYTPKPVIVFVVTIASFFTFAYYTSPATIVRRQFLQQALLPERPQLPQALLPELPQVLSLQLLEVTYNTQGFLPWVLLTRLCTIFGRRFSEDELKNCTKSSLMFNQH